MSRIKFTTGDANIEYKFCDATPSEELRINGIVIVRLWGSLVEFFPDYPIAIYKLHGAAKNAAEQKYLKTRAERLMIKELFALHDMVKKLQNKR